MSFKKLGTISKIRRGASPRPIDDPRYFGGEVGWVRISDVSASSKYLRKTTQYVSELGEKNSVRVNKGDLILSICGTVGKPIIIDIPACIHDGFVQVYDLNESNSEFLYYVLQHSEDRLKGQGQSGTQTNLNTSIVGNLEIFHPSIEEQTAIAEVLGKIDSAIEKTNKLIEKQKRIKQGLMQDLLTKGIDKHGNIRNEKTHKFIVKNGIEVAEDWNVEFLNRLCKKISDGAHQGVSFGNQKEVPFLFVSCIKPNEILWKNASWISQEVYLKISKGKEVGKGTVLYSVVGSYGNAVTVETDTLFTFQRHIAFMTPEDTILNPYFLTYYLNSSFGKKIANDLAIGNAQKTITLKALRSFIILLPPIEEQIKIIEKLKESEKVIKTTQNQLKKLSVIKQGLMQDLLTGKKSVETLIGE